MTAYKGADLRTGNIIINKTKFSIFLYGAQDLVWRYRH